MVEKTKTIAKRKEKYMSFTQEELVYKILLLEDVSKEQKQKIESITVDTKNKLENMVDVRRKLRQALKETKEIVETI